MNNNANSTTTGSTVSGGTHRSVSGGASLGSDSSLSSLQSEHSNVSSNDALHDGIDTRSEDARINEALSEDALSELDNDTIMNGGGELLEFDFDGEIQPLGMDQQQSMARDIRMLQRQFFEATRLSLTMSEDGTLASNAGALKRQLIMAKENYQLLFDDLVNATSAAGSNVNYIVPADTPLIQ